MWPSWGGGITPTNQSTENTGGVRTPLADTTPDAEGAEGTKLGKGWNPRMRLIYAVRAKVAQNPEVQQTACLCVSVPSATLIG